MHRWVSDMDHWLRTTTRAIGCNVWDGSPIFCSPNRAAFLGDAPITLVDLLNQQKRLAIGLLEVVFSKFSSLNFGIRSMGLLMGLAYAHIGMWAFWPIPITIYAFLPQLLELAYSQ
jgi:cellulose synthase/poly-beta-1,6-N-acetylglucosamine synthase-like glycosyltransferase